MVIINDPYKFFVSPSSKYEIYEDPDENPTKHPSATYEPRKKTRPDTPPKFNMEPENDGFQKESPFPGTSFQVPCQISGVYFLLKYW